MASGLLKLLFGLIPLVRLLMKWADQRKTAKMANDIAEAAINKDEAQNARIAAEVLAERRPDGDAARRMRDGSF